jgi:hypothetical protein
MVAIDMAVPPVRFPGVAVTGPETRWGLVRRPADPGHRNVDLIGHVLVPPAGQMSDAGIDHSDYRDGD